MFNAVGPEWNQQLENDVWDNLRKRYEYGHEVNNFIRNHPVGKRFYAELRDRALDVAIRVIFAESPEEAKKIIDEEFTDLKLANAMLNHFSAALVDGAKAGQQMNDPPKPQPER